ncbi:hypothetical protein ACJBXO_11800, partial [Streptococcus suis]
IAKDRITRIQKIQDEFASHLNSEELEFVTYSLEEILFKKWSTKEEKAEMNKIGTALINFAQE